MATKQSTIDYIEDQLADIPEIHSRKMFGEYALYCGDKVVALSDSGEVVVIATDSSKYTELARADILEGKCWTTPSLSGGLLYVRSSKEAACLDISPKRAER